MDAKPLADKKTGRVLTQRARHGIRPAVCLACLILMGMTGLAEAEGQSAGTSPNKDDGSSSKTEVASLFVQTGTDPSFKSLVDDGKIPVGTNSTQGVKGSTTIVKPHGCAIFQAKNDKNDWGVMINLSDEGNIILNHRRHQEDTVIATHMTGKSFDLKVRDNGHDYEVFLNGKKVGAGYYDRPEGHTGFRWGMYDKTLQHDAMIFVTGAKFQ